MSSDSDDNKKECQFGHVFEINGDHADIEDDDKDWNADDVGKAIRNEEIKSLEDLKDALDTDNYFLKPIMGEPVKTIKVSADSQGTPHTFILAASDKFGDELGWDTTLAEEKIFVSPQSQFHNDYLQKKQQAEQQVKQGMQSIEQLKKQKHILEHDIRKLRSRVENLKDGDEEILKGDFVQLVDGAGAGGGGGADQQALRFLRDNDFFPTIVSDFYEMDSVDDLKDADQKAREQGGDAEDYKDGKLAELPNNEKAILKKKYTMYEKWKDLFGSEVQRRLKDIKGELKRVERALDSAEEELEEPVRDMVMINQKSHEQLKADMGNYFIYQRHSTEFKQFEFIASQGVKIDEEGRMKEVDEGATHYKIFYIHALHVNIAGSEDPRTPAEGPTSAKLYYHPAFVCKHVYENIFEEKKNWLGKKYDEVMEDYTGEFQTGEGKEMREHREEEGLSVGDLRKRIGNEVEEEGHKPPLELSATIRRIEDGFDEPEEIIAQFEKGEEYLKAIDEILDTKFAEEDKNEFEKVRGFEASLKHFFGRTGDYYVDDPAGYVDDMHNWFKFNYYYDLKKSFGLNTMK